jgi:peptide/nickel transport system permease protein
MVRHIALNTTAPLVVQQTFVFAYAVIAEATLSFLGVGVPAGVPSWGNIISDGRNFLAVAPWMTFTPGALLALTVMGINLLGDGLRDLIDPRMKT